MRGAPCRPSASTSQPTRRSTPWRAAARQVKCAIWQPVTKPTPLSRGRSNNSSNQRAATSSSAAVIGEMMLPILEPPDIARALPHARHLGDDELHKAIDQMTEHNAWDHEARVKRLLYQFNLRDLEQHLAEILGVLSVVVLVAQHMVAPLEERTPASNVPTPCRLHSSDLVRARREGKIPGTVGLLLAWDLVHDPLTLILVAFRD